MNRLIGVSKIQNAMNGARKRLTIRSATTSRIKLSSARDWFQSRRSVYLVAGASSSCFLGVSIYVRQWRSVKLEALENVHELPAGREDLLELVKRTGQMGKSGATSVKDELDDIRRWHSDHGYKGGLVVRELTQPLFVESLGIAHDLEGLALDPMQLARRECYYMYYEIKGNGEINQQIFCRGTTLMVDILTCLSFWMVHDDELGCRVHLGFRNQAERILQDIEPLLAPAYDKRSTIEVSGHSLGGAVAYIIAAKLRKRGYRVIRATAIAAPRFCGTSDSSDTIKSLLPRDSLRIESDVDIVPFLPPFGHHVGGKLYLVDEMKKMVHSSTSDTTLQWLDSVFTNFRLPEILRARGKPHRVPYHISFIERALKRT